MLDIAVLRAYEARGLIKCQKHPIKPLLIWNYEQVVHIQGPWDEITSQARALVTDDEGNIVARSFKKFHNFHTGLHTCTDTFTVYEKLDGSLGILFWYDGEWVFASRGSFTSQQAVAGRRMLRSQYDITSLDKDLAYSFEIIYPENRIVVDYKERRELVFLAAFRTDGTEALLNADVLRCCGFPVAQSYAFDDYTNLGKLDWCNAEGFVVRFANGDRTKIKFDGYLALHRVASKVDGISVWKLFATGRPFADCIADVPNEFLELVRTQWMRLQAEYDRIFQEVQAAFASMSSEATTKAEFASLATKHPHSKLLFAMHAGEKHAARLHGMIAEMLRPKSAGKLLSPT